MKHVDLLIVSDSFQLSGIGLTFLPDFSVPDGWENRTEEVTVETPDGRTFRAKAHFNTAHFNIRDPKVPAERRFRVVVTLPDTPKEMVPIGSRLRVSPEIRDVLSRDA